MRFLFAATPMQFLLVGAGFVIVVSRDSRVDAFLTSLHTVCTAFTMAAAADFPVVDTVVQQ